LKSRFRGYTRLLREGQPAETALTRALGMPLPAIQDELRRYLERGQFEPITGVVPVNLSLPRSAAARLLGPAEANCRLGNELLRIDRLDDAEPYFHTAEKLAPASPLSREGLGMLAAARKKPAEAVTQLREALRRGSTNYLAHYLYAEERYGQMGDDQGRHSRLAPAPAAEIRAELRQSLALMPDFGPAHELLGFVELVQGEDLGTAEEQMRQAVLLEPDNRWFLLSLAEAQVARQEPEAARRTLESINTGRVDAKLRAAAAEVLNEINHGNHP
jgi:tetratricopeptide (TPR) repeat protein